MELSTILYGACMLAAVLLYQRFSSRGSRRTQEDGFVDGCADKRYIADRKNPALRWYHGVFALYNGSSGDPAYWAKDRALSHFERGWGSTSREEALGILEHCQDNPVNPAYDQVRVIMLARACVAAQWLSNSDSRLLCEQAREKIQYFCDGWESLAAGVIQGRAEFFDGETPKERQELDRQFLRFARDHVFNQVPFREPAAPVAPAQW